MAEKNNCFERDIKNSFEVIKKENEKFSEEIDFSWIETACQNITSFQAKIKKVNELAPDHPISLKLKEKKETVVNYLTEREKTSLGKLNDSHFSESKKKFTRNLLIFNDLKFSLDGDSILNDKEFLYNLSLLYLLRDSIINQQQELNEALKALSSEIQSTENMQEKWPEFTRRINHIRKKLAYSGENLIEDKSYSRMIKGIYDCIEAAITQSNKLETQVEQALKALISEGMWDDKAWKLSFWRTSRVPKNIVTMRAILSDDTLSHGNKMTKIEKVIKQALPSKRSRDKSVQQLYQQLNDLFKQHYSCTTESGQQASLSASIGYDETNSAEIIQTIGAITQRLVNSEVLSQAELSSSFSAASAL